MYESTTAGVGILPQSDGKVLSLVSGNTFNDVAEVDAADMNRLRTMEALAGRSLSPREQANRGLLDQKLVKDMPPKVIATTTGYKPPTMAQRARMAADHAARQAADEAMTPWQRIAAQAEAKAAELEAQDQAKQELAALQGREDVKAALRESRELRKLFNYMSEVRETEIELADSAIELAKTGQLTKFATLKEKVLRIVNARLGIDAKVAEREAEIENLRKVQMFLNQPMEPEPEPGKPRVIRHDPNNPEHVKMAKRDFANLLKGTA